MSALGGPTVLVDSSFSRDGGHGLCESLRRDVDADTVALVFLLVPQSSPTEHVERCIMVTFPIA